MKTIDQAYNYFGNYCLAFVNQRPWNTVKVSFSIFSDMVSAEQYLIYDGRKIDIGGFEENSDAIWDALEAAKYIRDKTLNETGERIWGLTFTLYPDGKFELEYDYDKPEDYEETNEIITGDEINQNFLK